FRFIQAMLNNEPVTVYGDGQQVRGNTFIADCVEASVAAMQALPGEIYKVGGGESASVWEILAKLEVLIGRRPAIRHEPARAGDQRVTGADTSSLSRHLAWQPRFQLDEGLSRQVAWQRGEAQRLAG